ncbi:MAG: tRNA (N(6)-L-threonylcarbamoyladenosine(37)-C(2))-methylthiotransferase MtaB [Nitrospirae bacterium]|nr:tRNA (N(6)-L-threonylcarbamoyladenosine(37)-C(2))-methylthiotransferase MtaB [Nitrospirota bacterium]
MRVAILTLGCRTNQAESFMLEQQLQSAGHHIVGLSESPDFAVINTCTVTEKADHQSEHMIRSALKKSSVVISTGCFSQLKSSELYNKYPTITIVQNKDKDNLINLIDSCSKSNKLGILYGSRHRPSLKVQDGCNFSCAYCTIPLARGASKSRAIDDVIEDVVRLEQAGYNEVVLCGIHLGLYGKDLKPLVSIDNLLNVLLEVTESIRFRLSSIEITEVSDELIGIIKNNSRVCRHLHLPMQSGDNKILESMNRFYTVKQFSDRIKKISSTIPNISLGTDVIVGFPGETDQSFNRTKSIINDLPITYLHAFPYSKRPNTAALKLDGHMDDYIKRDRVDKLRELSASKKRAFIRANLSKTLAVVTESIDSGHINGTTDNYIKVLMKLSDELRPGMLVNTRIEESSSGQIIAYAVKKS